MEKKFLKKIAVMLAAVLGTCMVAFPTAAHGERHGEGNGWRMVDGNRCYYYNGAPLTKNTTIGGKRYSFDNHGVCTGLYTGFTTTKSARCYYNQGVKQCGWFEVGGKKYYASEDGELRTGWMLQDGELYYFDEKGVCDGQKHYIGYQPSNMKNFLADFPISADGNYTYGSIGKDGGVYGAIPLTAENVEVVRKVLHGEMGMTLLYDERDDDVVMANEHIHYGKGDIVISVGDERVMPSLRFSKDENGDSYLYVPYYGFGGKMTDKDAFDKVMEITLVECR